ncbi:S-layer homology domain-containing protein [Cohnella hashimotonis]|uniref:S-layer homology domain-containing protein n=1 Tax=Cohnella hashimotonis TaxID=2826895 RepID=A0ABT6TMF0_9BACL|nr:S-layer homology domain-containing protein [Cohnella hashimotonis]MDI4647500.1 S-layer homology domain-containing protein [Cohnella hashimotonis]
MKVDDGMKLDEGMKVGIGMNEDKGKKGKRSHLRRWLSAGLVLTLAAGLAPTVGEATVAEAAAAAPARFTGAPSEWDAVAADEAAGGGSLSLLKAVQRGGMLYLLAEGTAVDPGGVFLIDADGDPATGAQEPAWSDATGIDYRIVGMQVQRYADGAWTPAGTAAYANSGTIAEAAVDIGLLGLIASAPLKAAYAEPAANAFLPDAGKPMLAVEAEAAAFGPDPDIAVDGDPADWSGSEPVAVSADGLTKLYAAANGDTLSIMVSGRMGDWNDIFIDTDHSKDTGFTTNWLWPDYGFDYMMENGALYASTGSGWGWSQLAAEGIQYAESGSGNGKVIEMSVPLGELGMTAPAPLYIGFNVGEVYAPAPAAQAAKIVPSLPRVTADGNDAEWPGIRPIATGTGNIRDLSAFVKNDRLYVLAHGYDLSGEKNLFIDADNDPETGHQGWQYAGTGADYLVQNGTAYKSTGSGWSWEALGAAESVVSSVYAPSGESVLETVVDMSGWEASSTVRVALGVGADYAPAASGAARYPAALSERGAQIAVDGGDGDWSDVDNKAASSGGSIRLRALRDGEKLFLLAQGSGLNTQNEYFIDADADGTTGLQDARWPGDGIDYKVSRNTLYRYDSASAGWTASGKVQNVPDAASDLVYLYLDQIGATTDSGLKVAYAAKNVLALPGVGRPMLAVQALVEQPSEAGVYYPRESFDVLNNPYTGWVAWARDVPKKALGEPYAQSHSMVYAGISWRELEPVKGEFDWAGIEEKYQFAYWASLGKKINLRIVMDTPTSDPAHKDIPDWLYDELVEAAGSADGVGKWYDSSEIGAGFAPNYNLPVLLEEHERMIAALAARYDEDPRIAYVQIGSLGHWGEFHNYPEPLSGKFPNVAVSDRYVQHYLDGFKHKLLGMRKPFPIAAASGLGLFNDVFGDKGSTESWLSWIRDGWSDIGLYIEPGESAAEVQAASKMPDFWKTSFSGGEFTSGNPLLSLADGSIVESLREARLSHTSWLGPSAPADYEVGKGGITQDIQENMDTFRKTIGYRYVLNAVKHDGEAAAGDKLEVKTQWTNKGVAPFYYDWPVAVALADADGRVVASSVTKASGVDIRGWLPGDYEAPLPLDIPADLASGEYRVLVGILDPDTGKPGIKLAIEGDRGDDWAALDTIRIAGTARPTPAPADEVQQVASLPAPAGGKSTVAIAAGKTEVRVPADAAFALGESLAFADGGFSLELPPGVLKQLAALRADGGWQGGELYVVRRPGGEAAAKALAAASTASAVYRQAGDAYELELGVRSPAGVKTPLHQFDEGLKLTLKLAEGADRALAGIYAIPGVGAPEYVGGAARGDVVTATVNHFSVYAVLAFDRSYEDVLAGHWAAGGIKSLSAKHIVQGIGDNRFEPLRAVTRAEFATMLVKAAGLAATADAPVFPDVPADAYYAPAVRAATAFGILQGRDDGRFGPSDPITRQEAAVMLLRAYEAAHPGEAVPTSAASQSAFADAGQTAPWAEPAVGFTIDRGLLNGLPGALLAPAGIVSRAQAAAMLSRWLSI